jgi:hypothetical protein
VPIVGFTDVAGKQIKFADVAAGMGDFRTQAGHPVPRPVLRALAAAYRSEDHYGDPKAVSVTTLIAPVQQKRLERRHDLYVDPLANLWAKWGTIEHAMFEDYASPGDLVERRLLLKRGGVTLGGTFDLLEMCFHKEGVSMYQGRDYKVTSAYGVKLMVAANGDAGALCKAKPDYFWQAQIYPLMAEDPDTLELVRDDDGEGWHTIPWNPVKIDNWGLVAISRDYNQRQHGVHFGPLELVQVPLIEKSRVENYIKQRLMVWEASEMCDDEGLPHCSPEETWEGRRCADYCSSAPFCHQFNPDLGL